MLPKQNMSDDAKSLIKQVYLQNLETINKCIKSGPL